LSIASLRPSTLATPSPTSRMTPTFCLAAVTFAPVICASISCKRSAICPFVSIQELSTCNGLGARKFLSKTLLQRLQTSSHAAVMNIAADLDAHSSDQRRIEHKRGAYARPIQALDIR